MAEREAISCKDIRVSVQGEMDIRSGKCLKGDLERISVEDGDTSAANPMQVQEGEAPSNYVYLKNR